jgi:toxin-antitoxin system PIN domain toxin
VILPVANLFLYAIDSSSSRHDKAAAWLSEAMSGAETVGLSWVVLLAFLRLSTRALVFTNPLSVQDAFDIIGGWLRRSCTTVVGPGHRHAALLRELLEPLGTAGNLTSDAHLAALAIEHGATLLSADADFSRFSGLRWRDPLRA